ncbi:MAG: hypothetical protein CL607_15305 [Anaerolineaceae bacterium]|nr:hypothetical protein [Anaerolineaceae bacterium]
MSEYRRIVNVTHNSVVLERAKWCISFWCRFRGLQFVTRLPENQGLLFVSDHDSKSDTTIHMLFMFMSIGVIWVNAEGIVVDKKLAKPWRLAYVPAKPAKYFIEANTSILERVSIGDKLTFKSVK